MKGTASNTRQLQHSVVVAMVLGTALTALAPSTALAGDSPEHAGRTITDISRYCSACWRNARLQPDLWNDCTQEVFTRLLERIAPDAWRQVLKGDGEERKEFLRAIDAVKKRAQRSRSLANNLAEGLADRTDLEQRRRVDERAEVYQAAARFLTLRQQRVLQLSFDGWSVQEIASEMKSLPERVSDEKYKAIRKLQRHIGSCA